MCGSMVDIQSPTAEIRRGKKEERKKEEELECGPMPNLMVALWNRADHYIFILSFVLSSSSSSYSSSSSSFFPRLISSAADWMSAILPHMVWP